ncbi:hypothetical protein F511_08789 [Dorcoceras hygrometricum]|uniref:Protein LITTLE ZIPPER 1-like n=1 Tax=Dorcoceras hygrometricum TaxID=472368 RepID=A0A2Z7ACW0_9LAMI|nr:hypothetical protein F511_08789 [Dorcoceras hygrometricum]
MCVSSSTQWIKLQKHIFSLRNPKRTRVHVLRLARRRKQWEEKVGSDILLRNLRLYMENISILEENEKLRKKATLLHQENLALVSEFQKKFPVSIDSIDLRGG